MKSFPTGLLVSLWCFATTGLAVARTGLPGSLESVGPTTEPVPLERYREVRYVSVTKGSDAHGDGTRVHPWRTLTYALSRAGEASSGSRWAILIAAGVYRSGTVQMRPFVDLYGGFDPQSWERDIWEYPTILDGQQVRRVVVGADSACLDGFVITHGLAMGHGGGILCLDTSPTISNNVIRDNLSLGPQDGDRSHLYQPGHHGGGIACLYNAAPLIRRNLICENRTAFGCGAGVAFYGFRRAKDRERPRLRDNRLVGGVQPRLEGNVIIANISGVDDLRGSRSSSGGAILCAYEARPIVRNNVIALNRALGRSDAGGIYCEYFSYPEIVANRIVGNVAADDGGGIYVCRLAHALIRDNLIAGNRTESGAGGGIRLSKEGRATIVHNRVVRNQGGGLCCVDAYAEIVGNVIVDNRGQPGLWFRCDFTYFRPSLLRDNVIRGNRPAQVVVEAAAMLRACDNNVEGGYPGGNLDQDPGFAEDGVVAGAEVVSHDSLCYTTVLRVHARCSPGCLAPGRVVRVGQSWTVIKSWEAPLLTVWGILGPPAGRVELEVLRSYMPGCASSRGN